MIETARRAHAHAHAHAHARAYARARGRGRIVHIEAVLNCTSNLVLNRLARGADFEHAVAAARTASFPEGDPSADLDGRDAAAKLAILAHEAVGSSLPVEQVARQPLTPDTPLPRGRSASWPASISLGERPQLAFRPSPPLLHELLEEGLPGAQSPRTGASSPP